MHEALASAGINVHIASAVPFRGGFFDEFAKFSSADRGSSLEEAVVWKL